MTIWMISGLHDSRWLENIVDNYARQTYEEKNLVLIENGNGLGRAADDARLVGGDDSHDRVEGVVVMQSGPGPAQPLNAALLWLRTHAAPNDWFAKCDSDDYYGPEYLNSITRAIEAGADYAGRSSLYIRTTDNRLWYVEGNPDAYVFHGPTIAGKITSSCDFPVVNDWGEDAEWCLQMRAAGRVPCVLPAEGVCYQRWGNYCHTWPCTDFEIRTSWSATFHDLGEFDRDVVDGKKLKPLGVTLEAPEFSVENSMAVRVLMEKLGREVHLQ